MSKYTRDPSINILPPHLSRFCLHTPGILLSIYSPSYVQIRSPYTGDPSINVLLLICPDYVSLHQGSFHQCTPAHMSRFCLPTPGILPSIYSPLICLDSVSIHRGFFHQCTPPRMSRLCLPTPGILPSMYSCSYVQIMSPYTRDPSINVLLLICPDFCLPTPGILPSMYSCSYVQILSPYTGDPSINVLPLICPDSVSLHRGSFHQCTTPHMSRFCLPTLGILPSMYSPHMSRFFLPTPGILPSVYSPSYVQILSPYTGDPSINVLPLICPDSVSLHRGSFHQCTPPHMSRFCLPTPGILPSVYSPSYVQILSPYTGDPSINVLLLICPDSVSLHRGSFHQCTPPHMSRFCLPTPGILPSMYSPSYVQILSPYTGDPSISVLPLICPDSASVHRGSFHQCTPPHMSRFCLPSPGILPSMYSPSYVQILSTYTGDSSITDTCRGCQPVTRNVS